MNTTRIAFLALAAALLLPGLASAGAPQDNDNRDACCLAAEYRLPESNPQPIQDKAEAKAGTKTPCQVPLGDVACCIGAEWVLHPQ
jgi:hypothetical protein